MTDAGATSVLIVDDHPVFRRGLRVLLEERTWIGRVLEAAGVRDAVQLAVTEPVDLVVMDLELPDGTGLQATQRLLAARPTVAVLVLTMSNDQALVSQLLEAGARGYLLKETDPDEVVDALHAVARGALVLGPRVALDRGGGGRPPRSGTVLDRLTAREREVLEELGAGRSNAQIARRLGLSEKTVRNHLSSVFVKLEVRDRTQAALLAREAGLRLPN